MNSPGLGLYVQVPVTLIEFLNFIDPDIQSKNINDKFLKDQKDFWNKWYQYREKRLKNILEKAVKKP